MYNGFVSGIAALSFFCAGIAHATLPSGVVSKAFSQEPISCYYPDFSHPRPLLSDPLPQAPASHYRVGYTAPAYSAPATGTVDLVVWRIRCVELGDKPVIALRMNPFNVEAPFARQYAPTIWVRQDGKILGSFGARAGSFSPTPVGFESGFRWAGAWWPDFFDYVKIISPLAAGTAALVPEPGVAFDAARGFDLLLGAIPQFPDSVVQVPEMDAPGNVTLFTDVKGYWWNSKEPGWGLGIDRNDEGIVFAVWNTYDEQNKPIAIVMPAGLSAGTNKVTGAAYIVKGPFFAKPFDVSQVVLGDPAGTFTFEFENDTHGTFAWSIGAYSSTTAIERFIDRARGEDIRRGAWWNSDESGWGLMTDFKPRSLIPGEANTGLNPLFAVWYTYGADNDMMTWFVAPEAQPFISPVTRYYSAEGAVYSPSGSFYGAPYDAAKFKMGDPIGKLTFTNIYAPFGPNTVGPAAPSYFDYVISGFAGRKDYKPFRY